MTAALRALPRCTETGLPIPFVTPRRLGVAFFRRMIPGRVARCCAEQRCQVCGERFARADERVFVRDRDKALQPPMHEACARFAVRVCPHLKGVGMHAVLIFARGVEVTHFDGVPMFIEPTTVLRTEIVR